MGERAHVDEAACKGLTTYEPFCHRFTIPRAVRAAGIVGRWSSDVSPLVDQCARG